METKIANFISCSQEKRKHKKTIIIILLLILFTVRYERTFISPCSCVAAAQTLCKYYLFERYNNNYLYGTFCR